jgi:hypothetical protein
MRDRSTIVVISILMGVVVLVWLAGKVKFVGGGPSKTSTIINNLRQLDGAVQAWAYEHHQPDTAFARKQDVAPYLHNGWVVSVAGEHYTIGSVTQSPQAELTRELGGRPKGSIFRLGTNGLSEIVLPNEQGGANGRQPVGSETNRTSSAAASRRSP